MSLSASVGHIVAILALLPPWILIYLVSGKDGLRDGWPLAVVGSLDYIAGQFPVAIYLGPYLPDVTGAMSASRRCFFCSGLASSAGAGLWRPGHTRSGLPTPMLAIVSQAVT